MNKKKKRKVKYKELDPNKKECRQDIARLSVGATISRYKNVLKKLEAE